MNELEVELPPLDITKEDHEKYDAEYETRWDGYPVDAIVAQLNCRERQLFAELRKSEGRVSQGEELYYIQDTRTYVGNSVMWWRPDGHGYTSNLDEAWRVNKNRALCMNRTRETDVAWLCYEIDAQSQRRFDMQDLRNMTPLLPAPPIPSAKESAA